MTEIAQSAAAAGLLDRARWSRLADSLAVAVAVSLPWSTSATSLLIALWLLAVLPTLRPAEFVRELAHPAGGLPVLLWLFAMIGGLWSEAGLFEQLSAAKGMHKLLVIPLLLIHFRRSDKGAWALGGFLVSCIPLLGLSWLLYAWPQAPWRGGPMAGVPVHDYIVQSAEFLICAFALVHLALDAWQRHRRAAALGMGVLALLFLANMGFVATGRTSITAALVLLLLLAVQRFGRRGILVAILIGAVLASLTFASSSYLRGRTLGVIDEIERYRTTSAETSSGFRLEFWKKSVAFVAEAPLVGHGTGSIPVLFRRAATGESGIAAAVTGNPHNQVLEIAVQFGLIGVSLLFAMWIAHFLLFRGTSLAAWLGQALVAQTMVGSLFLSYLLDFSTGWIYVFGVGVLGGMAAAEARAGVVADSQTADGLLPAGHHPPVSLHAARVSPTR